MKTQISTSNAPAAIGPYSQAIAAGGQLYLSGQIPLHPETGEVVGETAAEQATQVMKNLAAVLAAGGAALEDLVKTTIYLADLSDFAAVNEVYAGFLGDVPPARATVEVSRLPRDVRVEIDGIAVVSHD